MGGIGSAWDAFLLFFINGFLPVLQSNITSDYFFSHSMSTYNFSFRFNNIDLKTHFLFPRENIYLVLPRIPAAQAARMSFLSCLSHCHWAESKPSIFIVRLPVSVINATSISQIIFHSNFWHLSSSLHFRYFPPSQFSEVGALCDYIGLTTGASAVKGEAALFCVSVVFWSISLPPQEKN
ncbi:hypothetical protein H6P81_009342 [Aristolochia fimbriata]|uniref:Uncharacterized protein n=1 Tax=Aristolochia fimbriata TaxID=158543 RepID=A0AAV7EKK6_ARIFI|nr:hypothetical protein H6P81_009342 [Aristolochia fimbriata]